MSLRRWGGLRFAAVMLGLGVAAAPAAAIVRVTFNPVTQFEAFEGNPNLEVSVSIGRDSPDCPGTWELNGVLTLRPLLVGADDATPGEDFVLAEFDFPVQQLAIAQLTIERQLVLAGIILDDAIYEPEKESFSLELRSWTDLGTRCTLGPLLPVQLDTDLAQVSINDNDPPPAFTFQMNAAGVTAPDDAGVVAVGVHFDSPIEDQFACLPRRVRYRVFADTAEPGDFVAVADALLTFADGASTAEIPVTVFPDADGDDETIQIEIYDPEAGVCVAQVGSSKSTLLTLTDTGATEPTASRLRLATDAVTVDETAGRAEIGVLIEPSDRRGFGVHYRVVAGSAEPEDFTAVAAGTVEFAEGSPASLPIVVEIFSDADLDDETILVELYDPYPLNPQGSRPELGSPSAATILVRDTVAQQTVAIRFTAPSFEVAEDAGEVVIGLQRAPVEGAVRATLSIAAVTAEPGDFEAPAAQVVEFPAGSATPSTPVVVRVFADDDLEAETLSLTLSAPATVAGEVVAVLASPHTATLTILEPGAPPPPPPTARGTVRFAAAERRVAESDGRIEVELVRDGAEKPAFVARIETDGDATPGVDYRLAGTLVAFAEGQSSATLAVELIDDLETEPEETVILRLAGVDDDRLEVGAPDTFALRISASDQEVALAPEGEAPASVVAGAEVELGVRARRPDGSPAAGLVVRWALEARDGASATLLGEADGVTDAEGRASRRVRAEGAGGSFTLRATIGEPVVAEVRFEVGVLAATLPPPPPGVPASPAAPAIERLCQSPAGAGNPLCVYLFASGLTAAEQLRAAEELSGREATLLGRAARAGADEHLRGVRARMTALRGGPMAAAAGDLGISLGGRALSSGQIAAAWQESERRAGFARRVAWSLDRAGRDGDPGEESLEAGLPALAPPRPWGLFASGRISFGEKDRTGREPGFEFETFAFTLGADRRFGHRLVLGAALGLFESRTDLADDGGLDVSARDLTLYGLWQRENGLYLQLSGTYGSNELALDRRVELPRRGVERATATADGDQTALGLELGATFERRAWNLNGFGRLSWVEAELDRFAERSTGVAGAPPLAALEVADQGVDSLLAEVGLDLAYTRHVRWGLLRPLLRFSLLHELADDARAIRARLLVDPDPTNVFLVPTDAPDRDWASVGVGLQLYTLRGSLFLIADREVGRRDLETTRATIGLRREL